MYVHTSCLLYPSTRVPHGTYMYITYMPPNLAQVVHIRPACVYGSVHTLLHRACQKGVLSSIPHLAESHPSNDPGDTNIPPNSQSGTTLIWSWDLLHKGGENPLSYDGANEPPDVPVTQPSHQNGGQAGRDSCSPGEARRCDLELPGNCAVINCEHATR